MSDAVGETVPDGTVESLAVRLLLHDLRQPVMAMDVVIEMLGEHADLSDEVTGYVRQLGSQARWMSDMLRGFEENGDVEAEGLTNRKRGSSAGRPTYQGRVDLAALARSTASAAAASYTGQLQLDGPARVMVPVDRTSLRRAVANLLDNAMRAAGPRGVVRVTVNGDTDTPWLAVEDDGPGFGRVQLGNRLGLTLVAQVVITAGGHLEIGQSELGGARVVLCLPSTVPNRPGW